MPYGKRYFIGNFKNILYSGNYCNYGKDARRYLSKNLFDIIWKKRLNVSLSFHKVKICRIFFLHTHRSYIYTTKVVKKSINPLIKILAIPPFDNFCNKNPPKTVKCKKTNM